MNSKVLMAYCTFPNEATARQICESLVREDVIACANILPEMTSIYKWQDKLETGSECAAVLKTSDFKKPALMERLRALHPYQNPCLVFLNVDDGLSAFLNWVRIQTL